jgi:tripartite-type tricarboxylate transporter receptor subunit TctC
LPDVPTFEELSITQFPRAHFSLLGPAGLSTALVQRVNTDVRNAMRSEQLTTLLAPNALEALDVSAEEFSRSLAMQSQLYADIVKRIGLRLE